MRKSSLHLAETVHGSARARMAFHVGPRLVGGGVTGGSPREVAIGATVGTNGGLALRRYVCSQLCLFVLTFLNWFTPRGISCLLLEGDLVDLGIGVFVMPFPT